MKRSGQGLQGAKAFYTLRTETLKIIMVDLNFIYFYDKHHTPL
jgi:hypothetical protein